MENLRIRKICPFCPNNKSAYTYRTYHGLYRHIFQWHLRTKTGESYHASLTGKEDAAYIRIYTVKFSRFHDIPVHGTVHVDAIVRDYCKEFNPSLRGLLDER